METPLLDLGDAIKRELEEKRVKENEQSNLWYTKVVLTVLAFASAATALALVLAHPETFTINLVTTTDYRCGPDPLGDGYPAFGDGVDVVDTVGIVGLADVGLIAAFISVLAFLAYLFSTLFHSSEISQMNRGANPYQFVHALMWHFLVFLAMAFVAGISNVFLLTSIALFTWAWIFIFWYADLLNSYGYRAAIRLANAKARLGGASMWNWLPYASGWIFAVANVVFIFVYLGFTFSAARWDDEDVHSGSLITIVIVNVVFYLYYPIVIGLYLGNVISSIYKREMILYIVGGVYFLLATWLTIGLFSGSGVNSVQPV